MPKRVSPQVLAFALLLVSTVNLMLAVVPSAGDDIDDGDGGSGGSGGGMDGDGSSARRGAGAGAGDVNVNSNNNGGGDDGLGELGEMAVVVDGDANKQHAPISCSSLPIDEADECLRDRDRRIAEREARRKRGGGGGSSSMTKSDKARRVAHSPHIFII